MCKTDLAEITREGLRQILLTMGGKAFHGDQLFRWIHARQAADFDAMTDLPLSLRERLKEKFAIRSAAKILQLSRSQADQTTKYLFQLGNNTIIESVYMEYHAGAAICVSTQAGCRMGCAFCASAIGGWDGNLSASDMCAQVYTAQKQAGRKISRVVLMGSGEPLDNYDSTIRFIALITDAAGFGISRRRVTLSTCGVVPGIYRLAEENTRVTLAVSLHAPNDKIRCALMPIARKYPLDELLRASQHYAERTKRRVTYEYALIQGINDSMDCAAELSGRLKGGLCHVNLIAVNEVAERGFRGSGRMDAFAERLRSAGIETTIRRRLGGDISAACGQLRNRQLNISNR
ncbi:MAG: 23S rRNA (adenine(2503)-C(2))-methyltransferase RlmN [Clostridiales bacterium]|jgi:23S rRNA (adenine2503-C2)-methyltransferase|nr:23S rRNA (adenine(2503)-C(2))-methyltransferase RlmN [Clostridiales bacterium]